MEKSIIIQAGGRSQRMGENKALLRFNNETLVERVISRVHELSEHRIVTSNDPDSFQFLHLPIFQDVIPDKGALGGLLTAFSVTTSPVVIVVACDMPFVNAGLLKAQVDLLEHGEFDAVIPRTEFGCEPFHAVYRRESCLAAVKTSLTQGLKRADSWYTMVKIRYVEENFIRKYDPAGMAFYNINTPDEYQQALKLAAINPAY